MATEVYIVLGLVAIFIIGYIRIRSLYLEVAARLNFLNEYRNKFVELANSFSYEAGFGMSGKFDSKLYHWLTLNAAKAQEEVGVFGVGGFVTPFQRFKISNYQFIVNTIPKLRDRTIHSHEVNTVDDILVRCIGYYNEEEQERLKELRNPVKWFQYGSRFIISFPIRLLSWFGILSDNTFSSITASSTFKVLSGFVALLGFFSSIVTVFTGWDAFKAIMKEMIMRIISYVTHSG